MHKRFAQNGLSRAGFGPVAAARVPAIAADTTTTTTAPASSGGGAPG